MRERKIPLELLPGILLVAVLPVITRLKRVDTGLSEYPWFSSEADQGDFFLYWKGCFFLMLVIGMFLIILWQKKRIKLKKIWIPLIVYVLMAILSAIGSQNKSFSLRGGFSSYEGIFILIGYGVTVFYFAHFSGEKRNRMILLTALCLGGGIQGLLGISQIIGKDFWSSYIGKRLIAPLGENLIFRFGNLEGHQVYMASYHPNYSAVYCILLIPIVFAALWNLKKYTQKIAVVFLLLMLLICLLGTGSRTGMLTLSVMGILAGVCLVKGIRKKILFVIAMVGAGVVFAGAYQLYSGNSLAEYIKKGLFPEKKNYALKEIQGEENGIRVVYGDKEFFVDAEQNAEGNIVIRAEGRNGKDYTVIQNKKSGYYRIKPIKDLEFEAYIEKETIYLVMYYEGIPWFFAKPIDGSRFQYLTVYGKVDEIEKAPSIFFDGREKFLSNRGYIWSRSIPMLKKYLIIGSGPDNFALVFPQNDYVMKANLGQDMLVQAVTRPHNLYLQTAIETGCVSLAAMLIFLGACYKKMIRSLKEGKDRSWMVGILFSVGGYLCMGLTNDNMLVTAPVFFGILGMGLGRIEKEKR